LSLSDWETLFDKYNLNDLTHFNSTFKRADWNPDTKTYNIQFEDTRDSKQKFEVEADVLISAIGGFSTPLDKPPGLNGLDLFKGEKFHSARWNHSVDLKGKRVGVIGNGCSAGMCTLGLFKEISMSNYNKVC
jgi:cation diffusion facilitator CzcD-associated flavoprotein CzcO